MFSKIRTMVMIALAAAALSGCFTPYSLQPLYVEGEAVSEPMLLGAWGNKEFQGGLFTFEPSKKVENAYTVTLSDETVFEQFTAHAVRIEDTLFLDFLPLQEDNEFHAAFAAMIPVHGFAKVEVSPEKLTFRMISQEWFENLNRDTMLIPYQKVEDKIVITATTRELRDFIARYVVKDEKAFMDPAELFKAELGRPKE